MKKILLIALAMSGLALAQNPGLYRSATVPSSCTDGVDPLIVVSIGHPGIDTVFACNSGGHYQTVFTAKPGGVWNSNVTSGIVNNGTTGQFAKYLASGAIVTGYTLANGDIVAALGFSPPAIFGTPVAGNCAKWYSANQLMDAGSPCGSGGGSSTWPTLAGGTNTSSAFVVGSGSSLVATGTGYINATSVPASGVSGLATVATTGAYLSLTGTPAPTGSGAKVASAVAAGTSGNCAKWDASGNVADAGAPCGSGGGSTTWATIAGGTSTNAFLIGTGGSFASSGGTITATSVPASGVSGTLSASNLPTPTATTLGGVQSIAPVTSEWVSGISTSGVPTLSQPYFFNLGGSLGPTQFPAVTGDTQIAAGTTVSTTSKINGTSVPVNSASDQVLATNASAAGVWLSLPLCLDSGGQHLNYNTSTHAFSCGTSGGSGGGITGPGTTTVGNIPQWGNTTGTSQTAGLGLVTTVGTPGSNANVPTEAAVRAAIGGGGTLPSQTGSQAVLVSNGTTASWGNLPVGGSGALDCSTIPGTCDIVTSLVPLKANYNLWTGLNSWTGQNNTVTGGGSLSATPGSTISATTSQVLSASNVYGFGDSITAGYEACGVSGVTNLACAYLTLLGADAKATANNTSVAGQQVADMNARQVFTSSSPIISPDNNSMFTMMIGTNDAQNKGVTTVVANYDTGVFQPLHKASIAFLATANKYPVTSGNGCTTTGTWAAITGWNSAVNGQSSSTSGNTMTCSNVKTFGGPIYVWYYSYDAGTNASFNYSIDSGSYTGSVSVSTTPAIASADTVTTGVTYGWNMLRVPVSSGTHTILFTITSTSSGSSGIVYLGGIGTPQAQPTYGMPRVFVSGVPKQNGDANSAVTALYDSDAKADVATLAADGLGVYFVNIRNYLCVNVVSSSCQNNYGVPDMMTETPGLHPNQQGQLDLKYAFEQTMQFTPYPSGSGSSVTLQTNGTNNGSQSALNLIAGSNVTLTNSGSGVTIAASGGGSFTYPGAGIAVSTGSAWGTSLTAPASALVGVSDTQTLTNKSISSSQITGLATSATTDTTNASNISSGTLSDSRLSSDQCVLNTYSVNVSSLSGTAATPTAYTITTLASTDVRICYLEIMPYTAFAVTSATAATVRLQSSGTTPIIYTPNQDVTSAATGNPNSFWSDSGSVADRSSGGQNVNALFLFPGATTLTGATGVVRIVIGTRTMAAGY